MLLLTWVHIFVSAGYGKEREMERERDVLHANSDWNDSSSELLDHLRQILLRDLHSDSVNLVSEYDRSIGRISSVCLFRENVVVVLADSCHSYACDVPIVIECILFPAIGEGRGFPKKRQQRFLG